jgi:phosphate transport system substrate-binding protein
MVGGVRATNVQEMTMMKHHHLRALVGAFVALGLGCGAAAAGEISGAGSTFAAPVFAKWGDAFKQSGGASLSYQPVGSGGGIKQIKEGTVDFGASDMPLSGKDLEKADLVQWPTIMGGVVPVVTLSGVKPGDLKLDGPTLADIYLGKIAKWNDPAIAKLNPGLALPDKAIAVVHRSDASGTSFIFTSYLSQVSADWKSKLGYGTAVEWPVGVGGKGSEGVSNFTGQTDGGIGYVEYAYAVKNKMVWVKMSNSTGAFVEPTLQSFKAAAENADWAHSDHFNLLLTNAPGKDSWPITGYTVAIMHAQPSNAAAASDVLKFFDFSYAKGVKDAEDLQYVPLPPSLVKTIEDTWAHEVKGADGKTLWNGGH